MKTRREFETIADCVIDSHDYEDCIYAKPGMRKEQCEYWRVIGSSDVSESAETTGHGKWVSIAESMPEPGRKVLATYKNNHGKRRIIIASHLPTLFAECECEYDCNCEYDEKSDESFYPEGWYEQIENWDDFSSVMVDEEITHWMPLPTSP